MVGLGQGGRGYVGVPLACALIREADRVPKSQEKVRSLANPFRGLGGGVRGRGRHPPSINFVYAFVTSIFRTPLREFPRNWRFAIFEDSRPFPQI